MRLGTALRGAHFLVTKGSDLLRDDLAPHVTTAVEQTASNHYHAHVVDTFSALPVNHRERTLSEIEALYDEVLAEVVESAPK